MKRNDLLQALALFAALAMLLPWGAANAGIWRFAAIGDTPYSHHERRELPGMLEEIADENVDLVVHAGDFKDSRGECSDEIFVDRRELFDASRVPFFYVPGDNEWTDCRQLAAGHFDPLERLQKLRELFFAEPRSLGRRTLPAERQPGAYAEHLLWRLGPLVFISLNVPGPNNNFGLGSTASREFLARNPALIEWLRHGFAVARRERSPGLVIVMQANPGFRHHTAGFAHAGFADLLQVLVEEASAFPGQVLLIHGDTHWQRIDHPLRQPTSGVPLTNFTRIETFGYPFMGWVKVIFDEHDPQPFRFEVHPYPRR
ncbi:metallophosphoesterase family protein [Accumulibacter sp.]|uniref:metallophosphoesterase family protein n=1 Tax=Accumulibacter sp. TaxID=2053492 RepID=UPI0025F7D6C9|nr:metallophosphoesterase family protein [Accumulibacter sp.]MCM8596161.1 metallophosphoesterase [Accumulibacter sp.]MCM8626207.1 metallophosphoesterase [Accumulibacter sp.]MDS4050310.1 metallophosphoesterase family protein [Accumulibacter sp.]